MENKDSENISNGKDKDVSSTSNSYSNIQPRVVLERLSEDYTFGVATGSDNQPSTSGYTSGNKSSEADSNGSDDTSDSSTNTESESSTNPITIEPFSHYDPNRKEIDELKVIHAIITEEQLEEFRRRGAAAVAAGGYACSSAPCSSACPSATTSEAGNSSSSTPGECAYHAFFNQIGIDPSKIDTEGGIECVDSDEEKPTSPGSTCSEENSARNATRTEAKVQKAVSFLKLLVETYGRRLENPDDDPSEASPSTSRGHALRPHRNNLKDCVVRLWLPVRGQKIKKKFHVKLTQLISLVNNKNHPLHKFRNTLNLRTLRLLSDSELKVMARVLADFVCAKRVSF